MKEDYRREIKELIYYLLLLFSVLEKFKRELRYILQNNPLCPAAVHQHRTEAGHHNATNPGAFSKNLRDQ